MIGALFRRSRNLEAMRLRSLAYLTRKHVVSDVSHKRRKHFIYSERSENGWRRMKQRIGWFGLKRPHEIEQGSAPKPAR